MNLYRFIVNYNVMLRLYSRGTLVLTESIG